MREIIGGKPGDAKADIAFIRAQIARRNPLPAAIALGHRPVRTAALFAGVAGRARSDFGRVQLAGADAHLRDARTTGQGTYGL